MYIINWQNSAPPEGKWPGEVTQIEYLLGLNFLLDKDSEKITSFFRTTLESTIIQSSHTYICIYNWHGAIYYGSNYYFFLTSQNFSDSTSSNQKKLSTPG